VGAAPEVVKELEDVEVKAPKPLTLECQITPGDPKAELHWFKDNKEIYDGKKHQISYSKEVHIAALCESSLTLTENISLYE
jgi:hypothetical protein